MKYIGVASIGFLPVLCAAQSSAEWLAEVDVSQDASTVDVTLWVSMQTDEPFLGFASSMFDTLNQTGSEYGSVTGWEVLNNLDEITGDVTTTDGESLFGTQAAKGIFDITDANPIDVLTFTWEAEAGYLIEQGGADVTYMTSTEFVLMWVGEDLDDANAVMADDIGEAAFGWGIVPAPGAIGMLGLGVGLLARRPGRPTTDAEIA